MVPPPSRPAPPVGVESTDTLGGGGVIEFPLPATAPTSPMRVGDAPGKVVLLTEDDIP